MKYVTKLLKGNEAIGEGAILAGCRYYFGYPITPQNEIPEYMSRNLPAVGGTFVQSESELAAINLVMGAAAAGGRAMTSSSSPGVSLMQEGISYMAGMEVPAVVVNVVRGGPGLGGIGPAQSDYFQATKGGGHGDYFTLCLAPSTAQEMLDLTILAFDIADRYRCVTIILADGLLGQMAESVEVPLDYKPREYKKDWIMDGCKGRPPRIVRSLFLDPAELEKHNFHLSEKYREICKKEVRFERFKTRDADIVLVAYGTSARICKAVVEMARADGLKLGLLRPVTLYPFPEKEIRKTAERAKALLVVELSMGQMVQDVKRAVGDACPVLFKGRTGGMVFTPEEVYQSVKKIKIKDEG
ncbi:3-methyl-2-oxobutanoate dehydrogenase subunit VorB [Candidatus Sumerlaeota bacterium]|nr:3-methyl-2-oxobutanoate dehydrogenase subunit VorB [Candidatus Sumerlaeota bacterium]